MYRIAIIPGDGIGKEVMESGEYLLDKLDLNYLKKPLKYLKNQMQHYLEPVQVPPASQVQL